MAFRAKYAQLAGEAVTDKPQTQQFRKDINGLRAIAVSVVVLYHFVTAQFQGGFVGVDVFFVISGFLMTQIIVSGIERSSFFFTGFLWSRFKRIVPALAVMVSCLLLGGWFLVEPLSYRSMSSAAAASVGFYSNILYLLQSSYFALSSEENWLLHTWSLSVEWQFYMLYPVFLIAAKNFRDGRALAPLLIGATLLSFGVCIWMSHIRGAWAFYLLPFRSWELTAGGIVYLHASRDSAATARSFLVELFGIALIAASAVLINPQMKWPSFWAAGPVVGAMAVLQSNRGHSSLLVFSPMQAIGRWSYSIYLWHWPVIVAFRYFDVFERGWALPTGIGLSLLLGWISYTLVERPGENALRRLRTNWQRFAAICAPAVIVAISLGIAESGGAPARSAGNVVVNDTINAREKWDFPTKDCEGFLPDGSIKTCRAGGAKEPGVLVIGDSEAQEWYPRYSGATSGGKTDSAIIFATRAGCMPIATFDRSDPGHKCSAFAERAFALGMTGRFKRVILIAAWDAYIGDPSRPSAVPLCHRGTWSCTIETDRRNFLLTITHDLEMEMSRLRRAGVSVVLVLPFPVPGFDLPQEMAKQAFLRRPALGTAALDVSTYMAQNKEVRDVLTRIGQESDASILDPLTFMCDSKACPLVDERGMSLYKDAVHLRPSTARGQFGFLDFVMIH